MNRTTVLGKPRFTKLATSDAKAMNDIASPTSAGRNKRAQITQKKNPSTAFTAWLARTKDERRLRLSCMKYRYVLAA
jgi:hypothetical protein